MSAGISIADVETSNGHRGLGVFVAWPQCMLQYGANERQSRSLVGDGMPAVLLIESLNLTRLGSLRKQFSNFPPQAKALVARLNRGVYRESRRPADPAIADVRGPVVREVEKAQTFLSAAEVDRLVADYMAGVGVGELAERYGVRRATVAAHLRRRNVLRRRPGLDVNEQAESVRLYRDGMSLRAIGQRMGVDRKVVRALMVTAGVAIRQGRQLEA